jgi:hypothetical protein
LKHSTDIEAARKAAFASGLRPETLASFTGWNTPTGEEVKLILKLANLSGSAAGLVAGVDGRTIRRWTGEERAIPFAAWALLAECAGLGCIWR